MAKIVFRVTVGAAVSLIALGQSGCATRAANVKPSYVPPAKYASESCDKLIYEFSSTTWRLEQLGGGLDRQANRDAAMTALLVPMAVLSPVVFWRYNGDGAAHAEYSRLLGERIAIQQEYLGRQCAPSPAVAVAYVPTAAAPSIPVIIASASTQPQDSSSIQQSASTDRRAEQIKAALTSRDPRVATKMAKSLFEVREQDPEILNLIAERIENTRFTNDRHEGKMVAWLCKVLGNSGDARFKQYLMSVSSSALDRNITKSSNWAAERLPDAAVPQYFPPRK